MLEELVSKGVAEGWVSLVITSALFAPVLPLFVLLPR